MPLDIAVGIALTFVTHTVFQEPVSGLLFFVGIGSALLPDIDILTALFGRWRHRELTHYPLLYVVPCALLYLAIPVPYAFLISAGILAHFLHDTVGTGWGISWFWPFTPRRFLLLPDGPRRTDMGTFATWLPQEYPEWAHQGGHDWVRQIYFRPSRTALIEYGAFVAAVIALAWYVW